MTQTKIQNTIKNTPPENYQVYFVPVIGKPVAEDLLKTAKLHKGENVLDVACGTGVVARMVRERVGPEGKVDGLDINPGMIDVAKKITPSNENIQWHVASAEGMPMEDNTYDVVMCQMGLQFMEDKESALKEMHRVLDPEGRMLLNVPGPAAELFNIMDNALEKHISHEASMFVEKVFSLYDSEEIKNMMIRAGFHDINVIQEKISLRLPLPKNFFWQYISSTPLSAEISNADENKSKALEKEVVEKWEKYVRNGEMVYEQQLTIVTAGK